MPVAKNSRINGNEIMILRLGQVVKQSPCCILNGWEFLEFIGLCKLFNERATL